MSDLISMLPPKESKVGNDWFAGKEVRKQPRYITNCRGIVMVLELFGWSQNSQCLRSARLITSTMRTEGSSFEGLESFVLRTRVLSRHSIFGQVLHTQG